MKKDDRYYKSLLEDYEQAAFKLLTYEIAMENTEKLKAEDIPAEVSARADEAYPRLARRIRRLTRANEVKYFAQKQLPKVAKAAASLILVMYLGLTVAIASSETVLKNVVKFLIQRYDEYSVAGFVATGDSIDVPPEWDGAYYLSYIPEGFEFECFSCGQYWEQVKYTNDVGQSIYFSLGNKSVWTNYNTENSVITYYEINGAIAEFAAHESGLNFLTWAVGDQYFMLYSTLSVDDMIYIAKNISIVD